MNIKSPNWKEEELILVLDLYIKHDIKWLNSASEKTDEIIKMSNLLKTLNLFSEEVKFISNFRSPSSVHMKLMNFKGLDPTYGKYGLRNAGNLDRKIWLEYSSDRIKLKHKVREVLKTCYKTKDSVDVDLAEKNIEQKLERCHSYLKKFNNLCMEIRKEAIEIDDIDLSQKIVDCMYKGITFSNTNESLLEELINEIRDNEDIDHGNIKIGKYVQETFKILINMNVLVDEDIKKLLDEDWSRKTFHIGHPFLKNLQEEISIDMQIKVGKYQRYWKKEFIIINKKYLICKEWYESNREFYILWLKTFGLNITTKVLLEPKDKNDDTISFSKEYSSIKIKKDLLIEILNMIRKLDEEEICIETGKLNEFVNNKITTCSNYKNSQQVVSAILKYLSEKGIIVPFQNSKKGKYIIEDYELMANLINSPKSIIEI